MDGKKKTKTAMLNLFPPHRRNTMRYWSICAFLLLLASAACADDKPEAVAAAADEARLLRFPTIHDKQIVFTYAGDLYTVASTGGVSRKLTNHDGFEMFARLSPDAKWLAFTGQYDCNTEGYVRTAESGSP